MLKVFLFFTVCIVCCSASFDSLGGASISLVNYYQTNPLVNITISPLYGNLLWKQNITTLEYNEGLNTIWKTNCIQGSLSGVISFYILDNYTDNVLTYEETVFSITPISHTYISTNNNVEVTLRIVGTGTIIEVEIAVLNAVQKVNDNPIQKIDDTIESYKINYDFKIMNFTICNELSNEAQLLAFPSFWGRLFEYNLPLTIQTNQCESFSIMPKCRGGLVGGNLTYIVDNQDNTMNVVIGPGMIINETSGSVNCVITGFYKGEGDSNDPSVTCTIGDN